MLLGSILPSSTEERYSINMLSEVETVQYIKKIGCQWGGGIVNVNVHITKYDIIGGKRAEGGEEVMDLCDR